MNVRKPPKDKGGGVRKDSNTLPASVDYNDNLADMSEGGSSLSPFAILVQVHQAQVHPVAVAVIVTDSDSDNDRSSSGSCSERDNIVTVSDDSE